MEKNCHHSSNTVPFCWKYRLLFIDIISFHSITLLPQLPFLLLDIQKQLFPSQPSNPSPHATHTLPMLLKDNINNAQTGNKQHDIPTLDALPPAPLLPNLPRTVDAKPNAVKEMSVSSSPIDEPPHPP